MIDGQRIMGTGGLGRALPALLATALAAAALAGGGPAGAAARVGAGAAPHAGPVAGSISTVAGGVGGPAKATRVALFSACGVSFAGGSVYAGDGSAVRQVSLGTGRLTTPAGTGILNVLKPLGDGGPAARASLVDACGVAVDHAGNLVIADRGHQRIRVVAAKTGTFYGRPMTARHIYTVAGDGIRGFRGNGGPATSAKLNDPSGVMVDGAGNLVIADTGDGRVRVVATSAGTFYGQPMAAGDIYKIAGGGTGGLGDGGPATKAELSGPAGVAMDGAGNLLIADDGNSRIRVVAASTGTFYGQPMTAGDIYTVAGNGTRGFSGDRGPATSAELSSPAGVAADGAGNLLIADDGNSRIRVVAASTGTFYGQPMTAGDIYTVAGNGTRGFSGDRGPATSAELNDPAGVAMDGAGNLLIADSGNSRIRVAAASTGTFYGQPMTAGDIYTVAGNGTRGFSGDGGKATSADLSFPDGVAVDGADNLVIADSGNNRIRRVAG